MIFLRYSVVVMFCAMLADTAAAQAPPETQVRLWARAVQHMRSASPRAAIPLLERLVSERPNDPIVRAELAVAYFQVSDADKSRFHFNQALGGDLNHDERQTILLYLRALDERRDWYAALSFGLTPHSNATRRSDLQSVIIGGYDFHLTERPQPGVGLNFAAHIGKTAHIARDVQAVFSLSASGTVFEESAWDDYTLRGEAGLALTRDRGFTLGAGVLAGQRWLGGNRYSHDYGLYATLGHRLNPRTRLALRVEHSLLRVPDVTSRNAHVARFNLLLTHVPSPQTELRGRLFAMSSNAAARHESHWQLGGTLGVSHTFNGGWQAGFDWTVARTRYGAAHPVFNVVRAETETRLQLYASNRRVQWWGHSPVFEIGHERRRSTAEIFSYRNTYATIRLSRQF